MMEHIWRIPLGFNNSRIEIIYLSPFSISVVVGKPSNRWSSEWRFIVDGINLLQLHLACQLQFVLHSDSYTRTVQFCFNKFHCDHDAFKVAIVDFVIPFFDFVWPQIQLLNSERWDNEISRTNYPKLFS